MLVSITGTGSIPAIVKNYAGLYEGNLMHYFRAIFNNTQNVRNPYHNLRHLLHVLWLCHDASVFYCRTISQRERRNLLIAALFHDFDHTGNKNNPDLVNIVFAMEGLRCFIAPEDKEELENISQIILASEYPHKVPSDQLPLTCQILRDADVAQVFHSTWIQQVLLGLAAEWEKSPLEVLELQIPFLRNLKFHTKWARTRFSADVVEAKITEIQELIDMLTTV